MVGARAAGEPRTVWRTTKAEHRMLVIFDCDGVLVDSEPIVNRVEANFLSSSGWTLSPEESRALFKGHTFAEAIRIIDKRLPGVVSEDWVYKLAMATAQAFHQELEATPGVKDLLLALQQRNVPVCVASQSALPRVLLSLQICELDPFFGGKVYTASMVPRPKPAPDLFLHAASCRSRSQLCPRRSGSARARSEPRERRR